MMISNFWNALPKIILMTVIVNFSNSTLQFGSNLELVKCKIFCASAGMRGQKFPSTWSFLLRSLMRQCVFLPLFFPPGILSTLIGYTIPDWYISWWRLMWTDFKNTRYIIAPGNSKSPFWLLSGDPVKEGFPP